MKKILISADPYETRVAIVEDNVVVETYLERATRRSLLGNVYLGRVDNVLPGMEAAFIDAGLPKNGFLYVDEIVLPELDDRERRKKKIEQLIKNGQSLLVQVVKDPMGTKGARVTMDVSLAGRFLVYSPDGKGYGVSKRLPDGERDRLRDLVKQLTPKGGGGLIVRTAARGAQREELERDLDLLEKQWASIQAAAKKSSVKAPALIHEEVDLALEMVRDDLRVEVDEVITDDEATYERIRAFVETHSPEFLPRIKLHQAQTPLLRRYQVEDAIRSTMHRRVDLPSGGYLLFDYAEAFTIIDVNTGRFVGKSRLEDTILANNLEAAREVVRQLRLRDIGGMIVIDFIDMSPQKNRDAVIACLQEELKKDRSKVYLTSISPLGLVEMTRQNVTDGVREIMTGTCPVCSGEGRVLSRETIAIENLRTLRRHASLSNQEAFLVELDPEIAALMVGPGGSRLAELERSTGKHFSLVGVENVPIERCSVTREGAAVEILAEAIPVQLGQELELEIAEPHMFQAADAVAFLEGGYRIVVAGSGPYLGERHTVRIEHADRHEAIATLLTAKPVSEEEMLALIDRRTDIHEPERRLGERVDLEDRSRRRQQRRPPAKKGAAGGEGGGSGEGGDRNKPRVVASANGDTAEGGDAETRSSRNRRRRRRGGGSGIAAADTGVADGTVDVDLEDLDIDLEAAVEAGADDDSDGTDDAPLSEDGTPAGPKKRRRGRRGGKRHRKPGTGASQAGGEDDAADEGAEAAVAVADEAAAAPADGAAAAPAPRRRRTRAEIAAAAEAPAAEQAAPAETEPAAAVPPRRTRRTKAEIAAAAEAAVAEPEPAPPTVPVAPDPEAKPKRRRGIIKRLISADDD
jgi:ribonuclease G